ncbi:MAG TPA: ABC transporter permease [Mycobacteriales bacterium]|jgi:peptide/nickel transport system permease protein|nr:ABC transporter permease [Mycobacteriales bacterium]
MTTSLDPAVETVVPKPSRLSGGAASVLAAIRSFRSSSGTLPIGLGLLGFLVLTSLVSLIWTPYPPTATATGLFSSAPSAAHWFGTDAVGSDVFSRTISAGRTDVFYTVTAVAIALVIGSAWGAVAGFFGGWFETVTLRLLEVVQAFPALLMALLVISILGPGTFNVILVVAIIPLPDFVRLARAEVLTKKTWQFAEAARLVGNRPLVVLFKHLMPNSWRPLLAYASISAAWVCGNIAALGFIGVGIQPDAVEWGSMIARGESDVVAGAWWEALFPGLGVLVLAIGFQLVGDGIAARNRGEQR